MKVLMLTKNLDRPEANLMLGLSKKGIKIKLIMHRDSPFQEVLKGSSIAIEYWDFKNRLDIKSIFFLRKLFKRESIDIIHTFSARSLTSSLIASIFSEVKHVTYRGTTGHLSWFDPSSWLSYFNPRVSKIICVSDAVKSYLLEKGLSETRLARVYKGHREEWYKVQSNVKREDFNLHAEDFIVGCSANMRPVKGVDLLIKAFKEIPAKLRIKALLIGEVRDSKIENMMQDDSLKERIVFTGYRADAPAIVSFCDAFCMPSRKREGLPKALIEAMIQAVPCIISDVGGMPELVKNNQHGLVVAEENPKEIAQAIMKLYENREFARGLGIAARERIINNFSIENTVEQTLEVYQSLL